MKVLTHKELEQLILNNLRGVCFVSAKTETKQNKLNKGKGETSMLNLIGIDPDNILKHTELVFAISGGSVSYQDFVQNRLIKEAKAEGETAVKFDAAAHKWGKLLHSDCNAILTHREKGGRYLVAYCVANNVPRVSYSYQGQPIDIEEGRFDAWRKAEREEGARQGTENPIVIRDYSFNSLREITVFGETYSVVPE